RLYTQKRDGRIGGDLRRSLPGPSCGRRAQEAAPGRAADDGGAGGARALAASLDVAQGRRRRGLRGGHLRAWFHARRPRLRPLAEGIQLDGVGPTTPRAERFSISLHRRRRAWPAAATSRAVASC